MSSHYCSLQEGKISNRASVQTGTIQCGIQVSQQLLTTMPAPPHCVGVAPTAPSCHRLSIPLYRRPALPSTPLHSSRPSQVIHSPLSLSRKKPKLRRGVSSGQGTPSPDPTGEARTVSLKGTWHNGTAGVLKESPTPPIKPSVHARETLPGTGSPVRLWQRVWPWRADIVGRHCTHSRHRALLYSLHLPFPCLRTCSLQQEGTGPGL